MIISDIFIVKIFTYHYSSYNILGALSLCDILVVTPKASWNKVMIFAKNSDREPNEAQVIEYIPRMRHEEDIVKLTNIEYSQVKETYAILISRPWWIYGAEMGVNEYGLAIGNVAVFTKEPYSDEGMLGMDMLRLALERTRSAKEALEFIISLIEEIGQGGNYSYEKKFRYHNSFIIADPNEAWVLETAGKYWVAKKISDVYSISNALSIGKEWDIAHDDLVRHGVIKHGCSMDDFDFSKCYSDWFYTRFSHGRERRQYTYSMLRNKIGEIVVWDILDILRSHSKEYYHPAKGSMKDICMHYGGITRPSQTASSMIVLLSGNKQLILITGVSNPCLSMYKPFILGIKFPGEEVKPTNKYDQNNYWWRHEYLHRMLHLCYDRYVEEYRKELLAIEDRIIDKAIDLFLKDRLGNEIIDLITESFSEEHRLWEKWISKLKAINCKAPMMYRYRLNKINRKAGIPSM